MVLAREQHLSREQQLLAAQQQLRAYESLTGYVKEPNTVSTYLVGAGAGFTGHGGGSAGNPAVHAPKMSLERGVYPSPTGYGLASAALTTSSPAAAMWAGFCGDVSRPTSLQGAASQWGGQVVPKVSPFVSANRGIETLTSSVDVEALDASEAVSMPFQPAPGKALDLSPLALRNSLRDVAVNERAELDLSVQQRLSSWSPGWRTEMGLDAHEQALLKSMLGSSSNSALEGLVKKLWSVGNSVCGQTDRFFAHVQRPHAHEIPALQQAVVETTARARAAEAFSQQTQSQVVESQTKELVVLRKREEQRVAVCKQLKDCLQCPICREVAVLPKVLGTCGHIACQNCLKQLDDVAFATLTQSGAGASARQHLLARRCPLCRMEIIGAAFPVHPLKDVASILITAGYIEVADQTSMQRHIEFKAISFEKETSEQKHIAALQIGCYAQSQLAQHSVAEVITKINAEQWRTGVYVMFESAVSRVFFETFATTLHGRAGGVNVLVNAAQRMLAVQLVERKKEKEAKAKTAPHLLVKVGTDGRFVVTTATPTNAVQNPSASAPTPTPPSPTTAASPIPSTAQTSAP